MPIYEYRCQKCGCTFERLMRGEAKPEGLKCPDCGGQQVERLMSVFGIGGAPTNAVTRSGGCAPVGSG